MEKNYIFRHIHVDKGKLTERSGRKTTGLKRMLWQPGRQKWLFRHASVPFFGDFFDVWGDYYQSFINAVEKDQCNSFGSAAAKAERKFLPFHEGNRGSEINDSQRCFQRGNCRKAVYFWQNRAKSHHQHSNENERPFHKRTHVHTTYIKLGRWLHWG